MPQVSFEFIIRKGDLKKVELHRAQTKIYQIFVSLTRYDTRDEWKKERLLLRFGTRFVPDAI